MKKRIILALVCAAAATGANAQGFEWGAKAGVNFAWITEVEALPGSGDIIGSGARTGFHAGVFAEKVLDDFFGVQAELLYSQMGNRYDHGSDYKNNLDYLVLPVLAKVYPFGVRRVLSIDFGPQVGYMIRGAMYKNSERMTDHFKPFDAALLFGLSCKLTSRLDVSARCNFGLTKLADHSDAKNRAVQFGAGYRF